MNRLAAVLLILGLVLAMPATSSAASAQTKAANQGIIAQVSSFLSGTIASAFALWGDFTAKTGGTSSGFTTVIVVEQS